MLLVPMLYMLLGQRLISLLVVTREPTKHLRPPVQFDYLGPTCTASTESTPFSQAFRISKMAAGVLRQISCHFI